MLIWKWGWPKVCAPIKATTLLSLLSFIWSFSFEIHHQGDQLGQSQRVSINRALVYLPAGHGKGVAEELDGRLAVPNWIRVHLCFLRLVRELWVSLGIESHVWPQQLSHLNTVSSPSLELEWTWHCDRTCRLPKVVKTKTEVWDPGGKKRSMKV